MSLLFSGAAGADVYERFPLLDSMQEVLTGLPDGEELVLPCINSEIRGKIGWYDYIFRRENGAGGKPLIRWSVFNLSSQYNRIYALQQSIQDFLLAREGIFNSDKEQKQSARLSSVLDSIEMQNRLILSQLNKLQSGLTE